MKPIAIRAAGMVTPVGFDAASSCAAIRCGINTAAETRFMAAEGEWLMGCQVRLDPPVTGPTRLIRLVAPAIQECLAAATPLRAQDIPLLLCGAAKDRPGRFEDLESELLVGIERHLEVKFHPESALGFKGQVSIALALKTAERMVHEKRLPACVIASVDTLLVGATIETFLKRRLLLTAENSDGCIPGEAGAAVLVTAPGRSRDPELHCVGIGMSVEKSTVDSEEPLRGDGLVQAYRAAFADGGGGFEQIDYRIADVSGKQYGFREAALVVGRAMRKTKPFFDLWHPADCVGDVGAAVGPLILGVALHAARKGYAPGRGVLCHFGNEDGERAAVVLRWSEGKAA
ncbi:MAG TPA: hypothetical protein VFC90_08610 [Planctomycetota bacterium]|nr:hypothetical protein [Planctomycetota bacterium]